MCVSDIYWFWFLADDLALLFLLFESNGAEPNGANCFAAELSARFRNGIDGLVCVCALSLTYRNDDVDGGEGKLYVYILNGIKIGIRLSD